MLTSDQENQNCLQVSKLFDSSLIKSTTEIALKKHAHEQFDQHR